jgi:uncharacterized protein (TIGR04552 family)
MVDSIRPAEAGPFTSSVKIDQVKLDLNPSQLYELSAIRQALTGESVVDRDQLYFGERSDVDQFLRLCGYDTDNPLEMTRLNDLRAEAVRYLTEVQGYQIPVELARSAEIHHLFDVATNGEATERQFASMIFKVLHILYHITARELVFNTRVSEAELLSRLNTKVFRVIDEMRAAGVGVCEFAAGKKMRTSLTTKLLAKRTTLATHIFDKLRFRIIVKSREDLVKGLIYLMRHLVPFNYVLPGQSENSIITENDLAHVFSTQPETVRQFWGGSSLADPAERPSQDENAFSGPSYRCVNFVAEIPLRLDDLAPEIGPAIAAVETEVQLVDAATEQANTRGENSHSLYKERQRIHVRQRLEGPNASKYCLPRFEDAE